MPAPMSARACVACLRETSDDPVDQTRVRSNVRAFRGETFAYSRCQHCGSIHAKDEVDLAHYYVRYPFLDLAMDWRLRAMYARQVARFVNAWDRRSHRIPVFGCIGC